MFGDDGPYLEGTGGYVVMIYKNVTVRTVVESPYAGMVNKNITVRTVVEREQGIIIIGYFLNNNIYSTFLD